METDTAKKPNHGSLLARLKAAGVVDAVFSMLEAGEPLRAVESHLERLGIETSVASIHFLKAKHLHLWQAERIRLDAAREGIVEKTLPETVRQILLSRIGRVAVDAGGVDQLRVVVPLFSDWCRSSIAERAENRAERDSVRKTALRIEELLADADRLQAVRDAREAVASDGLEARLGAIVKTLWGDFGLGGEEAA
jgi:hypothetical protein